jgi:Arc/MetJ-type ribon-helix-helix transcriptional regulator
MEQSQDLRPDRDGDLVGGVMIELQPETERLVQEEIRNGHFHSVDEMIKAGVYSRHAQQTEETTYRAPKKNFAQFLLDSPLRGSGLNLERQAGPVVRRSTDGSGFFFLSDSQYPGGSRSG